jgi:hypothetical protein
MDHGAPKGTTIKAAKKIGRKIGRVATIVKFFSEN